MSKKAIWARRVAGWRESGLPSAGYCEGKPFTAGALRYWASRLRQEEGGRPSAAVVRLARVVRGPALLPEAAQRQAESEATGESVTAVPEALVVECGAMRVAVRPGFDRETFAAILEVLVANR